MIRLSPTHNVTTRFQRISWADARPTNAATTVAATAPDTNFTIVFT